ncbi:hypothetical protein [Longispora albida]|uniref:hypothetical protein n=1 Tax=Longispora albida TaxID=203523 RepID=UPI00037FC747|nr:hypothetical protein [Longispora albida]
MLLPVAELSAGVNEASDLLAVRDPAVLAAHGWSEAVWTVLDEGPVEECVVLIGHGAGGWEALHVPAEAGTETGRTEDAEALAWRDGYVYVLGSHFGSKKGPLRARRAFAARFPEASAADGRVKLEVARNKFRLHRAVNDALAAAGIEALGGHLIHHAFIASTRERGTERGKKWVHRVQHGDLPLNIEGAAFSASGALLLGLRFPVTSQGRPVLVELLNPDCLFTEDEEPRIGRVWTIGTGGTELLGFRALSARPDGGFDAIVGSIDATGKDSVLLEQHPHGGGVHCRHIRFYLSVDSGPIAIETVADLPFRNVEGVAELSGRPVYVTDEDHRITLWA